MEQARFRHCAFLPLPSAKSCHEALTTSCSDLIETVLALHCNGDSSAQDAMSMREAAERRSQFSRLPARSVSAPSRKKWFRKERISYVATELEPSSGSQDAVCDEFTRKLVAAITTWHDIHSSLLRLSIERSSSSSESLSSQSEYSEGSSCDEEEEIPPKTQRFSISNPELTNCQIKQLFPDLSEHWRQVSLSAT